jgi:cellulose synthase (UDP-forming)
VVLQATDETTLAQLREALLDPAKLARVQGDLVLVRGAQVDAYRVGNTYEVGSMAWWRWIWFQLHQRPLLLVALAGLFGLLIALPIYRSLRLRAQQRLRA